MKSSTVLQTRGCTAWLSKRFSEARRWLHQIQKPRVLILTGLTCSGKTDLSLSLAKELNGEVISADSVQVYRGLDIGSGKVTLIVVMHVLFQIALMQIKKSDMQGIRHHLIDICDPSEDYSAGRFFNEARAATEDILSRGKVPIVVGGTGFYLKWYVHGTAKTGTSTPESRQEALKRLEHLWEKARKQKGDDLTEEEKWKVAIYALEAAGDIEAARRIEHETNNYYRLTRALEIVLSNDCMLTELDVDVHRSLDYDFRCFFLHRPRLELYARIEQRCESMSHKNCSAVDCIPIRIVHQERSDTDSAWSFSWYKHFLQRDLDILEQKLQQNEIELTDASLMDFLKGFESATRKLVKQQITWFRNEPLYHWIDLGTEHQPLDFILAKWHKLASQRMPHVSCTHACLHSGVNETKAVLTKEEQEALKRYAPTFHEYGSRHRRAELIQRIQSIAGMDAQLPDINLKP